MPGLQHSCELDRLGERARLVNGDERGRAVIERQWHHLRGHGVFEFTRRHFTHNDRMSYPQAFLGTTATIAVAQRQ